MDERERTADVVRQFYDGWNRGQIDFDRLVAADILNHQPEAEPQAGRAEFAAAVRNVKRSAPGSRWTISDLLVDRDRVAARVTWSGTYRAGSFRGATVSQPGAFSVEHIHIYRVADEQLAEHWVVRDDLAMLRQVGALGD